MRLVQARPLVEEVALSGFGEDDEFGRRGRRGGRRGGGRRGGQRGRMRRRSREDEDDEESEEVSGRKERRARRRLRRKQRGQRQSLRAKQKLKKSRGGRRKKSRRSAGGSRAASSTRRSSHSSALNSANYTSDVEPTEESAAPSRPRRGRMSRRRMQRSQYTEQPYEDEEEEFFEDDFFEDPFEEELEDEIEDEALEGTRLELGRAVRRGLLAPGAARRVMDRVRSQLRDGRQRRQNRRSQRAPAESSAQPTAAAPGWNPPGAMGRNLQVQARSGHRAAVMELRDGLYLVADIASSTTMPSTQGEDVGAILPALMVRAAAKAIQRRRQNRNALDALQPRQLPGPTHQSAPLQLHGPIAGCAWSD